MGFSRLAAITVASAIISTISMGQLRADAQQSAADIERLASELDSGEFATRQTASQRLGELGKSVFPALEKAAQSESREASARAIEILKRHLSGGENDVQAAAKETLERIARSNQGPAARRASEILSPPKPVAVAMPANMRVMRPANGQIPLQLNRAMFGGNIPANVRRVHIRTTKGVKEVTAEENGRKVSMTVDPAKGIEMEVTETKDGKTTSKKYSAKNAEELKKNHPEAHQIYEQYGKDGDGVRIQGGFRIAPGAMPGQILPNAFPRPAAPQPTKAEILKRIDDAINAMDRTIENFRQRGGNSDSSRRAIETMETNKRGLLETRARIAEG